MPTAPHVRPWASALLTALLTTLLVLGSGCGAPAPAVTASPPPATLAPPPSVSAPVPVPAAVEAARVTPAGPARRLSLSEGSRQHQLLQQGDVSVHLVVTRPPRPRVVFAFAAGNSGAGLWPTPAEVS